MTITLQAPATSYLERLKKTSGKYQPPVNSSLGIQNNPNKNPMMLAFGNPNEHMTEQRSLVDGNTPQLKTDRLNVDGLQERELLTATAGDIATTNSQNLANKRRSQQNAMFNSFSGELGGGFEGDGGDSGLDGEQLNYAKQIANIGKQRGLGQNEIQIAIMTALAESGLRNLNHGDRDSVGLFQQRTSQGWGSVQQIMDPTYSANKFYDALGKSAKGSTPWQTAQNVQRSAFADGSNYQAQYSLALRAYKAISSTAAVGNNYIPNANLNSWVQANNDKYIDYDGAFGAQCVDLYNKYTATFVGGKNFMVGYAPEIFNSYDRSAYTRFGANQTGRAGDVVIWGQGPYTPSGHVAIVVGDNGNGTLRVLQSNATAAGSRGNSIISNISKQALMGYLRPNKLMGG